MIRTSSFLTSFGLYGMFGMNWVGTFPFVQYRARSIFRCAVPFVTHGMAGKDYNVCKEYPFEGRYRNITGVLICVSCYS